MGRLILVLCVIAVSGVGAGATAGQGLAASSCVGGGAHCFTSLQAAVDAAHDGDVIHIRRGTFEGGVTIDKDLKLIGAGADATVIAGGGPVLTIGEADAAAEPTVTIKGVTVTGGLNTSDPEPYFAAGGGIVVPASADGIGATVTIDESRITGNRAAPESTSPSPSGVLCGGGTFCPYAQGEGGGIYNAGTMTLNHVTVSNNEAGSSVASDADAGGISNQPEATLELHNSVVSDNVARAPAPNGRFAEGGGIFSRHDSTLAIDDSVVSGNAAELVVAQDVLSGDTMAQSGGIRIGGGVAATIRNSRITGNRAFATNLLGDSLAFAGGIDDDGSLVLRDSTVADNQVRGTSGDSVFLDAGALEIEGTATIRNTRFTGNSVSATATRGLALAQAGAIAAVTPELVSISDSVISGNSVTGTTTTGSAVVQGGGIQNGGALELRNTRIADNTGTANGPDGLGQGGGIWNGQLFDEIPNPQLTLRDSKVTRNTLSGSPGIDLQGGGMFTSFPVTLENSVITDNAPDQCYGC